MHRNPEMEMETEMEDGEPQMENYCDRKSMEAWAGQIRWRPRWRISVLDDNALHHCCW